MAKFIYKMQNILDIKNKLETQEKTAFAIEVQKLRVEEERLVRIRNEIEYYEDLIRDQGDKQINILEWKRCNEALEYKKNEEKIQIQHIKLAEKNVDIARGRLNKVMIENPQFMKEGDMVTIVFRADDETPLSAELPTFTILEISVR